MSNLLPGSPNLPRLVMSARKRPSLATVYLFNCTRLSSPPTVYNFQCLDQLYFDSVVYACALTITGTDTIERGVSVSLAVPTVGGRQLVDFFGVAPISGAPDNTAGWSFQVWELPSDRIVTV